MARVPTSPQPPANGKRRLPFGRKKAKVDRGPSAYAQIKQTYTLAHKHDRRILLWPAVAFVVTVGAGFGLGFAIKHTILVPVAALILALPIALRVFLGRARPAIYSEAKDRPGIALHEIRQMRGDWKITEAVQFNRNQEFVHRIVGKPGVILVAEGRSRGVRDLLTSEARRTRRIAPDSVVHEVIVGDRDGEVPLVKLRRHLLRLPRSLKGPQIKALDVKLKAVANTSMPIPKGPLPTRAPRGKMR